MHLGRVGKTIESGAEKRSQCLPRQIQTKLWLRLTEVRFWRPLLDEEVCCWNFAFQQGRACRIARFE